MTIRTADHPHLPLGRLRSPERDLNRTLRLKHFLSPAFIQTIPDVVDYTTRISSWPMALNGDLGDCTAAGATHAEQVFSTYGQGAEFVASDATTEAFYSGSTGYRHGQPATDQGGDMATVLKYWRRTGLAGRKIAGYFSIDPTDLDELRAAVYLFGPAYIGFNCPRNAQEAFDRGAVWDYDPSSPIEGGHCVIVPRVVKGGTVRFVTWGGTAEVTPAFWRNLVDEPYAIASQEWINDGSGLAPPGIDGAALNAAFKVATGKAGPFTAAPPKPAPTPTPVPVVDGRTAIIRSVATSLATDLAALNALLAPPVHGR